VGAWLLFVEHLAVNLIRAIQTGVRHRFASAADVWNVEAFGVIRIALPWIKVRWLLLVAMRVIVVP
jgi:hypothetical protein